jgi:hypothetical protein
MFILINLDNGFINQNSHVLKYLVLVVSSYFADDWWEDKYPFFPRFCQ